MKGGFPDGKIDLLSPEAPPCLLDHECTLFRHMFDLLEL